MAKAKKIVVREINLKKAVISHTIFAGIIGLVLGIVAAIGLLPIPLVGVYGAIGIILLNPLIFAVVSALCTALCVVALNFGLKYSDGFEILAEY